MIFTCKMYVYIYAYVCMRQLLLYSRTALHRNVESDGTKKVRDWLDLAVGGLKLFGGFNWGRPVTVNYLSKSTNEYQSSLINQVGIRRFCFTFLLFSQWDVSITKQGLASKAKLVLHNLNTPL